MKLRRWGFVSIAVTCWLIVLPSQMRAQATQAKGDTVKIGVLAVFSSFGADYSGNGAVLSVQMAVDDFGGKVNGKPIEVLSADTQQKADVASSIVREWFDRDNVDVVVDVPSSPVALAISDIAKERNKVVFLNDAGSNLLSGKRCAPTVFQWTFDSYNVSVGTVRALTKRGYKSWYFLVSDMAYGHDLFRYGSNAVKESGGDVVGSVEHPMNNNDFSSQLLQAQASKAAVIAMADGPPDNLNAVKQATQFRIREHGKVIAPFQFGITDVHSLGLDTAQGLIYTTGFYWDMDADTRAFAKRYFDKMKVMPNWYDASLYSAVTDYLKAVKAAKSTDGIAVAAKIRELPVVDFMAKHGTVRPDNRMSYPLYLVQVKSPQESKYAWDYLKILATITPEEGYLPLAESECPMVKK